MAFIQQDRPEGDAWWLKIFAFQFKEKYFSRRMAKSISQRKFVGGRSGGSKNSPETANWVPKSASAGLNQNLLWELSGDPGELKEDDEPNPAKLSKLKGRI